MFQQQQKPVVGHGLSVSREFVGKREDGKVVASDRGTWIVQLDPTTGHDALDALATLAGGMDKAIDICNKGVDLWSRAKWMDREPTTPYVDLLNALVDASIPLPTPALLKAFGQIAGHRKAEDKDRIAEAYLAAVLPTLDDPTKATISAMALDHGIGL
jgi:hypothetical protein